MIRRLFRQLPAIVALVGLVEAPHRLEFRGREKDDQLPPGLGMGDDVGQAAGSELSDHVTDALLELGVVQLTGAAFTQPSAPVGEIRGQQNGQNPRRLNKVQACQGDTLVLRERSEVKRAPGKSFDFNSVLKRGQSLCGSVL